MGVCTYCLNVDFVLFSRRLTMAKCMRQRPCTLVQLPVDMTAEYYLPKNVKKIRGFRNGDWHWFRRRIFQESKNCFTTKTVGSLHCLLRFFFSTPSSTGSLVVTYGVEYITYICTCIRKSVLISLAPTRSKDEQCAVLALAALLTT